ncbi:MBL fold metallo-hydrolase [Brachybacterium sp. GPGPB12]|uniref:ComEC/Rec2 family competence protein n=1 Tax=Brachybacterium sp. GPGPB12 TaxID=3023517 RepID=UPI0031344637
MDACLDLLQVPDIDLLVLTHPHADHTGGRDALTGARTPAAQWVCPAPASAADVVPGAPVEVATTGTGWEQDGLALTVLWPDSADAAERASAAEQGSGEGDAANDCSIALEVRWADGTRLVTLGDLEPAARAARLAATEPGPADIVKVAHHGSRFQHAPLYERLDPDLALVPVGQENTFGHPTDEPLDLVRGTGAQVLAHRRPRHRGAPHGRGRRAAERRARAIGAAVSGAVARWVRRRQAGMVRRIHGGQRREGTSALGGRRRPAVLAHQLHHPLPELRGLSGEIHA